MVRRVPGRSRTGKLSAIMLIAAAQILFLRTAAAEEGEKTDSIFQLEAGPTGKPAEVEPPVVSEKGLTVVEISKPCKLDKSDTKYVLTQDVTSPGNGFSFASGVKNTILDLGGHTIIFNEEAPAHKTDKMSVRKGRVPYGIVASGKISNIVIRNGIILQGKAKTPYSVGIRIGGNSVEIHHMTIKVYGKMCYNIYSKFGGNNHRIHDNYMENHNREKFDQVNIGTSGIHISQAGNRWDIYNNTIIGGHRGIEIWMCGPGKDAEPDPVATLKIHHNFLSPLRIYGVKGPHGIFTYKASGVEIYENEIQGNDSRGINTQSRQCLVHHNFVDCRYSTNARTSEKGGYIENRCYGFWERGCYKNKVHDNVFIVNNDVEGDGSSSSMGIHASQYGKGDDVNFGEYFRNRIITFHKDKSNPAPGIFTKQAGGRNGKGTGHCKIYENEILAGTAAIELDYPTNGAVIKDNLCVDPGNGRWKMLAGSCIEKSEKENNKKVDMPLPAAAPKIPEELKAIKRFEAVELRWKRNAEKDVLGYNIYRDGKRINTFLNGTRFYVDLDVKAGSKHSYTITAVDLTGKESGKAETVQVSL